METPDVWSESNTIRLVYTVLEEELNNDSFVFFGMFEFILWICAILHNLSKFHSYALNVTSAKYSEQSSHNRKSPKPLAITKF